MRIWTHWDLNPGPSACGVDVMPLHHVPLSCHFPMRTNKLGFGCGASCSSGRQPMILRASAAHPKFGFPVSGASSATPRCAAPSLLSLLRSALCCSAWLCLFLNRLILLHVALCCFLLLGFPFLLRLLALFCCVCVCVSVCQTRHSKGCARQAAHLLCPEFPP